MSDVTGSGGADRWSVAASSARWWLCSGERPGGGGHEAREECAALGAGLQIEGPLARTARVIHCHD